MVSPHASDGLSPPVVRTTRVDGRTAPAGVARGCPHVVGGGTPYEMETTGSPRGVAAGRDA